jgi:hypothetical protein
MNNSTTVFEIKKGRTWSKVRATSMTTLNQYCKENGFTDWRMVGMMSRSEMIESQSLTVVA